MSQIADSLRRIVEARAGHRCEYCHLAQEGQAALFPVDHVQPLTAGGATTVENLALACSLCNAYKWAFTTGIDPATREEVPLFHPRHQNWQEHFQWSAEHPGELLGVTPCGRATISRLDMNRPHAVKVRQLMAELGLFPELPSTSSR